MCQVTAGRGGRAARQRRSNTRAISTVISAQVGAPSPRGNDERWSIGREKRATLSPRVCSRQLTQQDASAPCGPDRLTGLTTTPCCRV
ncbi:unnamed protein product [Pleuronectes platessa]|uniref:Uncharacterized protein n=1 Tax=Pleuronectes platessa TaxID=8262 RepID=A0A9N7TKY4_PLEPL|nr:unnamed protein product [Pleuronectes platessa]